MFQKYPASFCKVFKLIHILMTLYFNENSLQCGQKTAFRMCITLRFKLIAEAIFIL